MKVFIDRWFWRILAVAVTASLWVIAIKLPGSITSDAWAGMKKEDGDEKYALTRLEYAQIHLNTHPHIRIMTPHLMSEYHVTENGIENIVVYDKGRWESPEKFKAELLKRDTNAMAAMQLIGFKDFQAGDIRRKLEAF